MNSSPGEAQAGPGAADAAAPDRRLRVFVSSTLGELAGERDAARAAVQTLRLSPVMFDLGSRPRLPRDVYRSHLDRSDVFVGIYWQSYGWIAPNMAVSTVEDEYELSTGRPRLIYVKEPAAGRDPRLERLIARMRSEGATSFKTFDSPGELAELLLDDLARVVSERHDDDAGARPRGLPSGTVTFMFSDIEGSTQLLERLDADYADVLHRYHGLVRAVVAANRGTVVDTEGDGIFCVFDETLAAAVAAVEIQQQLASGPLAHDAKVRARIGLHTGRAIPTAEGYVGIDVHRAARIGAAGHGGQIMVSATVSEVLTDAALDRGWQFRDLGSFALKGLSRTEQLHQLSAEGLDTEFPEPKARRSALVRLPGQLTSLVDRKREREDVASLLVAAHARLVTLTGAGGIGKTRLALAVAEQVSSRYPDGVFFVNLAALDDPGQVLAKVAESTGTPVSGSAVESLTEALAHQRVLLVLDNFEQVVGGAPAVTDLLGRCPGLHALVTSRVALRIAGEHEYRVEPLPVPGDDSPDLAAIARAGAVQLFADRARAVRPSFAVTDANAAVVAAIARRLDGLPLAIELAAARLRVLTPDVLLLQLTRSIDALGQGPTDQPERQRTLRSTIDWSYALLNEEERAILARVSVLAGPWPLDTAVRLGYDVSDDVVATVESLVDKSLVRVETGADGEPRFRLLSTIREYAAGRLRDSGEEDAVRERHAALFVAFAERMAPLHRGAGHTAAMARLDDAWEDIREAASWLAERGDAESVARVTHAVWVHVWLRGHIDDTRPWVETACRFADDLTPRLRGRLLWVAGGLSFERGDYGAALDLFDQSIELLAAAGDEEALAWAHYLRAATLPAFDVDAAMLRAELTDSLRRFRRLGDDWGQCWALINLGLLAAAGGGVDEALEHQQECLRLATHLDNQAMVAQAHTQLGFSHLAGGRPERARECLTKAVEIHRTNSLREGLSYCLDALSSVALYEGYPDRAMVAVGAAEGIRHRLSLRPWPAVKWYLDFMANAADAVEDDALQAARATGRNMDPLAAATFALGG